MVRRALTFAILVGCATSETPLASSDAGASADAAALTDAGANVDANAAASDAAGVDAKPVVTGKRVFATSKQQSGAFGGLAGADEICQELADAASLGGSFKAYVSDATEDAKVRIAAVGPWSLVDGTLAFPNKSLSSYPSVALDMDETGKTGTKGLVWTGTKLGGIASGTDCGGWSTTGESGTSGYAAQVDQWSDDGSGGSPCTLNGRLYCFEQ